MWAVMRWNQRDKKWMLIGTYDTRESAAIAAPWFRTSRSGPITLWYLQEFGQVA